MNKIQRVEVHRLLQQVNRLAEVPLGYRGTAGHRGNFGIPWRKGPGLE